MRFRVISMPGAILLSVLLAACGGKQKGSNQIDYATFEGRTPERGGTLVMALRGDPVSLEPLLAYSEMAGASVVIHLFPPLVRWQEDPQNPGKAKLTPLLAESWEVSRDGKVITFHLRKGVVFEDGHPLTTKDVEFTYRKAKDPNTKTIVHFAFDQVKKLEVVDDYTFKVHYAKPFVYAVNRWDIGVLPAHLLEGKDINTDPFNRHPVGYGPFKFREWVSGDHVTIEANDKCFLGRPYLDRIVFRIIPEVAVQILEFKAGNLDWVGWPTTLTPSQYHRELVGADLEERIRKYRYKDTMSPRLTFNLRRPMFQDKRVRQAINYAIDKESIIEGVLLGLGRPCDGPIAPESWAYNPNIRKYPFNPGEARKLLAEAGWKDSDGDGVLDQGGQKFEFTLLTGQSESMQQIATILQQQFKAVGLAMKIKTVEWSVFLNTFVAKRDFDMCISMDAAATEEPDLTFEFHSSQTGDTEYNWATYVNPELDRLLEGALTTFDIVKRKTYLGRAQEILCEDLPVIYLYMQDHLGAISRRIQGPRPYPPPLGIDHNMDWWWIPTELQGTRMAQLISH